MATEGTLVVSNAKNFNLEQKINLKDSRIKEIRVEGKGAIKIFESKINESLLLRFRDREERRKWLSYLGNQKFNRGQPVKRSKTRPESVFVSTPFKYKERLNQTIGEELDFNLKKSKKNFVRNFLNRIKEKRLKKKLFW